MKQLVRGTIFTVLVLALSACEGGGGNAGSNDDTDNNGGGPSTADANQAQKGPFRAGATVTVSQLDSDGVETDNQATAVMEENGSFTFPSVSWEGPSLIAIDGTFFNEVTGNFSSESRSLTAIVDLPGEEDANVNLYTHMVAEGVRHYMGDGHDFHDDDIRRIVRDALKELTGITSDPNELDLLHAAENPEEADGANLLLFSAAFLEAGLDASDLAAIIEDFQGDGDIDAGGEDAWRRLQLAREDNPDLLPEAVQTLQNQYSTEPPASVNTSAIAWLLDPCQAAKANQTRVVCVDDSFHGDHAQDNEEWVTFVPLITGRYTIYLSGDPGVNDDNANTCNWELNPDTLGDSDHTDGFCGVEDYTAVLQAGEEYPIYPRVGKFEDQQAAYFILSADRNSDGTDSREGAVEMKYFPFDGYVGTHIGASDNAYYRFSSGSAGEHTISVGGYPCAGSSHVEVELYEAPLNATDPFDAGYSIASSSEESCSQTITQSLEASRDYFVKITNKTAYMENFRPAPASTGFSIDIQR